jgi:hypothetical protein
MHKKLIATCISLVALAALALPAMASASAVTTEAGGFVATGTAMKAFGTNWKFATSAASINCNEATLEGKLHKNDGTTVEGTVEKATFKNNGNVRCPTSIPGITAEVTVEGLHWCITSSVSKSWALDPRACTVASGGAFSFKLHIEDQNGKTLTLCRYERTASVTGSNNTGAVPADLTIGASQTFERKEGSALYCGATGTLTGESTLTAGGSNVKLD